MIADVLIKSQWVPEDLQVQLNAYRPQTEVGQLFWRLANDSRLDTEMRLELLEAVSRIWVLQSELSICVYRGLDGTPWLHSGDSGYDFAHAVTCGYADYHRLLEPSDLLWQRLIEQYGVVSRKVITNGGVNHMVSDFAGGGGDITNFHFHGIGTGTGVEAATDAALGTELTTEYASDNIRATGTQVDNSATPHTFTTVGTNTLDSGTPAITEHGIFTTASTGTNTLWDRSKFSAINLVGANGDGLSSTYTLSISAGG